MNHLAHREQPMYLIFLFPYSLTEWDATRFGFKALMNLGVNIKVFDLSPLIRSRSDEGHQFIKADYITKIESFRQFDTAIKSTVNHARYIDCINGLNGFQFKGCRLFQILKKYNARYYLVEIGSLPLLSLDGKVSMFDKLKKALSFRKLYKYVHWKIGKSLVRFFSRRFHWFQLPDKIFVGSTDMLTFYVEKYCSKASKIIPIHSFDYDRYLAYMRNTSVSCAKAKKICVFLDQALATHSDFGKSVSFNPVTAEKYFLSMNRFFDYVEKETGLEVIIASSPRSNHSDAHVFGKRTVISGRTLELVAECSLVIMHSSTAVSFAVLFNKPILIVTTQEMVNAPGFSRFIANMGEALHIKPVCIDHEDVFKKIALADYENWKKDYDDYKYKYVMTKDLDNKTTWEIVAHEFCQDMQC